MPFLRCERVISSLVSLEFSFAIIGSKWVETSTVLFCRFFSSCVCFKRIEYLTAGKRGGGEMALVLEELGDCVAAPGCVEEGLDAKELARAIRAFLNTLPEREQDIFLRRYFFVEESGEIAKRYGMKPATVLRTLSRTREKLKKYLTQEGYAV